MTLTQRTIALIEHEQSIANDDSELYSRLHVLLCMKHPMDDTAQAVLASLIDFQLVAKAMDALNAGTLPTNLYTL